MSLDDDLEWPALGDARLGARFVLGVHAPGTSPPSRGDLPGDFSYQIGTVGALAGTLAEPYLVTAGHVVVDVEGGHVAYPPAGTRLQIGFRGNGVRPWRTGPPLAIRPTRAERHDGALVDAVAVPLPPDLVPAGRPRVIIDDALDLPRFLHREAFMLVQRRGRSLTLGGFIEQVLDPGPDARGPRRPQRVALRFTGETSVAGDSGAPVMALDDAGRLHLLGFHYKETGLDPDLRVDTTSLATAAAAVRDHIGLPIL